MTTVYHPHTAHRHLVVSALPAAHAAGTPGAEAGHALQHCPPTPTSPASHTCVMHQASCRRFCRRAEAILGTPCVIPIALPTRRPASCPGTSAAPGDVQVSRPPSCARNTERHTSHLTHHASCITRSTSRVARQSEQRQSPRRRSGRQCSGRQSRKEAGGTAATCTLVPSAGVRPSARDVEGLRPADARLLARRCPATTGKEPCVATKHWQGPMRVRHAEYSTGK